jgi:hypothetical protein
LLDLVKSHPQKLKIILMNVFDIRLGLVAMRGDIRPRSQENEGPTEGIQYLVQRFFNK